MKSVRINQEIFQVAEIELTYRPMIKPFDRPKIRNSKEAYDVLLQYWNENKIGFIEEFKVILLNRAHHVLGIYHVSTGGLHGVSVDIRLIFAAALKGCACNIILSHNHPSGDLHPSPLDKELTQKVKNGAMLLDICLHDHIIVAADGYFSFADEGLL